MASLTPIKQEFADLYEAMSAEVRHLGKGQLAKDAIDTADLDHLSQVERRNLIRSVFAFFEAMCFGLKQLALDTRGGDRLTPAERAVCLEEAYDLGDNGEVETRPARLRFLSNIRFALKIGPRAAGIQYSPDLSGAEWTSLREALKVRDRLMHPKHVSALNVSDSEVRAAFAAFIWMNREIIRILLAMVEAGDVELAQLRKKAARRTGSAV